MKVKGYYNVNNGVFLGPVTAVSDSKVMHTPRYVEGVCFGEFDTVTEKFVPETNPYKIVGSHAIYDTDGSVSGMEEDKGLDIAKKEIHSLALGRTPGVTTVTEDGKTFDANTRMFSNNDVKNKKEKAKSKKQDKSSKVIIAKEMPKIDFDELF